MPTIKLLKTKRDNIRTIRKVKYQDIYQNKIWKWLRTAKLRANPLCEDCEREGKVTPTAEVHHIIGIDISPELAFDYDNLLSLCIKHHKLRDRK